MYFVGLHIRNYNCIVITEDTTKLKHPAA